MSSGKMSKERRQAFVEETLAVYFGQVMGYILIIWTFHANEVFEQKTCERKDFLLSLTFQISIIIMAIISLAMCYGIDVVGIPFLTFLTASTSFMISFFTKSFSRDDIINLVIVTVIVTIIGCLILMRISYKKSHFVFLLAVSVLFLWRFFALEGAVYTLITLLPSFNIYWGIQHLFIVTN
jgi:uncharacterized membrane protein